MAAPHQRTQQEPEGKPRPWEQPGAQGRDCRPHRGPWLLMLSGLGLLSGAVSSLFIPTCLVGGRMAFLLVPLLLLALPLCAAGWVLAGRDLAGMGAGLIDPAGEEAAVRARQLAFAGFLLALAGLFPCLVAWVVMPF
jgi:hypothetical protein